MPRRLIPLLLVLALVGLVLPLGSWAAPRLPLRHPLRYGIHVADFSDRQLARVSAAGFGWVRAYLSWASLEPAPGQYAWQQTRQNDLDNVLRKAKRHHLRVLLRLAAPPPRAGGQLRRVPPAALRTFLQALAAHAGDRVGAYEIFNEVNLPSEWGGAAEPEHYTALLRAAYAGVKAGNPRALVLPAGLAPTTDRQGGVLDDLVFLRRMYRAGAQTSFDALAAHPFGFAHAPAQRPRFSPKTPGLHWLAGGVGARGTRPALAGGPGSGAPVSAGRRPV